MLSKLTSRLFGSSNERQIKKYKPIIDQINNLENKFSGLSDEQLKLNTKIFKDGISSCASVPIVPADTVKTNCARDRPANLCLRVLLSL